MIIIESWCLGGDAIHISTLNKFKLLVLCLQMICMVCQDHFGSIVRSKFIEHNTYTGCRIISRSKPTPKHELVNKSELNFCTQ